MKVLVTGAAGFVGQVLVDRLVRAGFEVIGTHLPGDPPPAREQVRWMALVIEELHAAGDQNHRERGEQPGDE